MQKAKRQVKIQKFKKQALILRDSFYFLVVFFTFSFLLLPLSEVSAAGELSVSPAIIDEKGYARDILTEPITLTNNSSARRNIYITVEDVDEVSGEESFERVQGSELSDTLANWTKIKRHVEVEPNSTEDVELTFHINLTAEPGIYHATVNFYEGSNRAGAEARGPVEEILLNFEVLDDTKEFAQLNRFRPARTFFSGFPVEFEYELENIGNTSLTPGGEIIIYNRRGREVTSVKIAGNTIDAEENAAFAVKWQNSSGPADSALASVGSGVANLGKYKAVMRLQYGDKNPGTLQDTIYFWIIPWQFILAVFVVLGGIVSFMVHKWHRRAFN